MNVYYKYIYKVPKKTNTDEKWVGYIQIIIEYISDYIAIIFSEFAINPENYPKAHIIT